jgi:hypothetical protein
MAQVVGVAYPAYLPSPSLRFKYILEKDRAGANLFTFTFAAQFAIWSDQTDWTKVV